MKIHTKDTLMKTIYVLLILIGITSIFFGDRISEFIIFQVDSDYSEKISELKNIYVYKTRTGERYHRSYHYSNRNYKLSLYSALHQGLTPCQVCKPISRKLPQRGYLWIMYIPIRILLTVVPFTLLYFIHSSNKSYPSTNKIK